MSQDLVRERAIAKASRGVTTVRTFNYYVHKNLLNTFYRENEDGDIYRLTDPVHETWNPDYSDLEPAEDLEHVPGYVVAEYIREAQCS